MQTQNKDAIVMQLGSENLRMGSTNDRMPRVSLPVGGKFTQSSSLSEKQHIQLLESFLFNGFFAAANLVPTGRTVVLLVRVYFPKSVLEKIVHLLLSRFKAERVQFSLSCVTPLYLSSELSGIVISVGASHTQIMPVIKGIPQIRQFGEFQKGTYDLNQNIIEVLTKMNPQPATIKAIEAIASDQMDFIRNKCMENVSVSKSQSVIVGGVKIKFDASKVSLTPLFGKPQEGQFNLAAQFLELLESLSYEQARQVATNIIVCGGFWCIASAQRLFRLELRNLLPRFPLLSGRYQISDVMGFVNWGFNPIEVSWMGAKIGASSKHLDKFCLTNKQYAQNGFIDKIAVNYFGC